MTNFFERECDCSHCYESEHHDDDDDDNDGGDSDGDGGGGGDDDERRFALITRRLDAPPIGRPQIVAAALGRR